MRIITSVLLLLGCALGAGAQQTVRYVVQLQNPPTLAFRGASRVASSAEATALSRIEQEHSQFEARAVAAGFTVVRRLKVAANAVIVEGPAGSTDTLRGMAGVKRAFRERTYQQHFDASIPLHQIDSAWAAIPGATYNPGVPTGWNIAGQGVKIGILDSGIEVTHPYFQAPNMTAPSGFPKWSTNVPGNQAFTSGKIIVARSYGAWTAQDIDGHGTAVASVAAGVPIVAGIGPNGMALSGVAPAAWLGNYDVDANHDGNYPDSAILPALDDCASDGMDVVSMSWGSQDFGGSLDPENQLYQEVFATLRAAGIVIVASAGNGGPAGYTVSPPAIDPGVIAAGAQQSTTVNTYSPTVTATDGTNIAADAADNNTKLLQPLTAPLVNVTQWDSTGFGCTNGSVWPRAGVASGKILLIQRGGAGTPCTFVEKLQNAQAAGALGVVVYNQAFPSDGSSGDSLIGMDLYQASSPSAIANFPGLFVGYTDGQTLVSKVTGGFYTVTLSFGLGAGDTHQLADFSARGPIADLTIKPDLVAAGQSVVTAWCSITTLDVNNNTCDPFGYQLIDGTSFSAPITAGAIAVIKSARPGLTGDDYRSLVVNSASPMLDDNGNSWPVLSAGAGSLDVLRAINSTVTANPISLSFGATGSSVTANQQLTLKNVGTATTTYKLSFEGLSSSTTTGSPVTLASGGTVYMPFPNLGLGDYLGLSDQAPVLWTRSVTLAAGAVATVTVQAPPASGRPGAYQGFIDVTPNGSSVPDARIPWWYAVTTGAPNAIALDSSPLYLSYDKYTGYTDGTIVVRFVDNATGVMLAAPGSITVTTLTGSAIASTPYQASSQLTCHSACTNVIFPNVWLIDVTTSPNALSGDTSTFQITSGNLSSNFTAIVQ
jgi:minor extracellular serine protease Vpr